MEIKNWWTSKPYWIKGGVLGIVFIALYYSLFTAVLSRLFLSQAELLSAPFALPFILSLVFFGPIFDIPLDVQTVTPSIQVGAGCIELMGFVILFALYFLLGALIGWAVGKIKTKK